MCYCCRKLDFQWIGLKCTYIWGQFHTFEADFCLSQSDSCTFEADFCLSQSDSCTFEADSVHSTFEADLYIWGRISLKCTYIWGRNNLFCHVMCLSQSDISDSWKIWEKIGLKCTNRPQMYCAWNQPQMYVHLRLIYTFEASASMYVHLRPILAKLIDR